jgi:hypothetical protein
MRRAAVLSAIACLAAACGNPSTTPAAPAAPAPIPAPAPTTPAPAPPDSAANKSVSEAFGSFDPSKQHIIWVLPEGVHGAGPWDMDVTVKHKGEVKYHTSIRLDAEIKPGGSRPEYPANTEVVRLSGGATYPAQMRKVNAVIQDIIAKFGHGDGELDKMSELKTKIDDAHAKAYCVDGKKPVVLAFIEEDHPPELTPLALGPLSSRFEASILKNCKTSPT